LHVNVHASRDDNGTNPDKLPVDFPNSSTPIKVSVNSENELYAS